MIKRILVPIDFSETALQALDYAIDLGRQFKSEIVVVHVLEPLYYPGVGTMYGIYDLGAANREIDNAAREQLAHVATRLQRRRLPVRTVLLRGAATHTIVGAAKKVKADLIVMSTHGRTGLAHMLMGSVAEGVVRYAACPVLTVRGQPTTKASRPRRSESKK